MPFIHMPLAKALDLGNVFTYQDYLYELCADFQSEKPVTEQQWEMICDLIGSRSMCYASTVSATIKNMERKKERASNNQEPLAPE